MEPAPIADQFLNRKLGQASIDETNTEQQYAQNIINNQMGLLGKKQDIMSSLSEGGLARDFSLEDFQKQSDLARQLADQQANSQNTAAKYNLWGNVAGTVAGVGAKALWS